MIRSIFVLTVLFGCQLSYAQDIKAVLVQLSSEQNRTDYFQKKGDSKDVKEIVNEAKKVNKVTMLDFKDHFTYCPVYFYIDTNRELIKNKHFEGVLLDAKGMPVKDAVINPSTSDYIIAYYGYSGNDNSAAPDHAGLVILNDQLKQIYFLFRNKDFDLSKDPLMIARYSYSSARYDIGYKPFATRLNVKMEKVMNKMEKYGD